MTKRLVKNALDKLGLRVQDIFDIDSPSHITGAWPSFTVNVNHARSSNVYHISRDRLADPSTASTVITNALAEHKIVQLPVGTFSISSPIIIGSNQTLLGVTDNDFVGKTIIKPVEGYDGYLLKSNMLSEECIFRATIAGIQFDGSDTTLTAINLNVRESVICNVMVRSCYTYGIRIGGISDDADSGLALNNVVSNVRMFPGANSKFYVAIFEDYFSSDNLYDRNYLEGSVEALIETRGANVRITNNHLYLSDKHGIVSRDSGEKIITGNYIENLGREAIRIAGDGVFRDYIISHNIFRNVRKDTTTQDNDFVISWQVPIKDSIITNNIVRRDNVSIRQVKMFTDFNGDIVNSGNVWHYDPVNSTQSTIKTAFGIPYESQALIPNSLSSDHILYPGKVYHYFYHDTAINCILYGDSKDGDMITLINFTTVSLEVTSVINEVDMNTINDEPIYFMVKGIAYFSFRKGSDSTGNWLVLFVPAYS